MNIEEVKQKILDHMRDPKFAGWKKTFRESEFESEMKNEKVGWWDIHNVCIELRDEGLIQCLDWGVWCLTKKGKER